MENMMLSAYKMSLSMFENLNEFDDRHISTLACLNHTMGAPGVSAEGLFGSKVYRLSMLCTRSEG